MKKNIALCTTAVLVPLIGCIAIAVNMDFSIDDGNYFRLAKEFIHSGLILIGSFAITAYCIRALHREHL